MDAPRTVPEDKPPRRRRRGLRITLLVLALLVVAVGGVIVYALSESGLAFLVARVVAQSARNRGRGDAEALGDFSHADCLDLFHWHLFAQLSSGARDTTRRKLP